MMYRYKQFYNGNSKLINSIPLYKSYMNSDKKQRINKQRE